MQRLVHRAGGTDRRLDRVGLAIEVDRQTGRGELVRSDEEAAAGDVRKQGDRVAILRRRDGRRQSLELQRLGAAHDLRDLEGLNGVETVVICRVGQFLRAFTEQGRHAGVVLRHLELRAVLDGDRRGCRCVSVIGALRDDLVRGDLRVVLNGEASRIIDADVAGHRDGGVPDHGIARGVVIELRLRASAPRRAVAGGIRRYRNTRRIDRHVLDGEAAVVLHEHLERCELRGDGRHVDRAVIQLDLVALLKVQRLVLRAGGADRRLNRVGLAIEVDRQTCRCELVRSDEQALAGAVGEQRDGVAVCRISNGFHKRLIADAGGRVARQEGARLDAVGGHVVHSRRCGDVALSAIRFRNRNVERTTGNNGFASVGGKYCSAFQRNGIIVAEVRSDSGSAIVVRTNDGLRLITRRIHIDFRTGNIERDIIIFCHQRTEGVGRAAVLIQRYQRAVSDVEHRTRRAGRAVRTFCIDASPALDGAVVDGHIDRVERYDSIVHGTISTRQNLAAIDDIHRRCSRLITTDSQNLIVRSCCNTAHIELRVIQRQSIQVATRINAAPIILVIDDRHIFERDIDIAACIHAHAEAAAADGDRMILTINGEGLRDGITSAAALSYRSIRQQRDSGAGVGRVNRFGQVIVIRQRVVDNRAGNGKLDRHDGEAAHRDIVHFALRINFEDAEGRFPSDAVMPETDRLSGIGNAQIEREPPGCAVRRIDFHDLRYAAGIRDKGHGMNLKRQVRRFEFCRFFLRRGRRLFAEADHNRFTVAVRNARKDGRYVYVGDDAVVNRGRHDRGCVVGHNINDFRLGCAFSSDVDLHSARSAFGNRRGNSDRAVRRHFHIQVGDVLQHRNYVCRPRRCDGVRKRGVAYGADLRFTAGLAHHSIGIGIGGAFDGYGFAEQIAVPGYLNRRFCSALKDEGSAGSRKRHIAGIGRALCSGVDGVRAAADAKILRCLNVCAQCHSLCRQQTEVGDRHVGALPIDDVRGIFHEPVSTELRGRCFIRGRDRPLRMVYAFCVNKDYYSVVE